MIKNNDIYFMQKALQEAKHAFEENEVPVGCIIVDTSGSIISSGRNQTQKINDILMHAEMQALHGAQKKIESQVLSSLTLYVTLEPCLMCMAAITLCRVSKVVYALPCEKFGACDLLLSGSCTIKNRYTATAPLCYQGPCGAESEELLREFFKKKRV